MDLDTRLRTAIHVESMASWVAHPSKSQGYVLHIGMGCNHVLICSLIDVALMFWIVQPDGRAPCGCRDY